MEQVFSSKTSDCTGRFRLLYRMSEEKRWTLASGAKEQIGQKGARWDCLFFSLIRQSKRFYIIYQKIKEIGSCNRKLCLFYDFRPFDPSDSLMLKTQTRNVKNTVDKILYIYPFLFTLFQIKSFMYYYKHCFCCNAIFMMKMTLLCKLLGKTCTTDGNFMQNLAYMRRIILQSFIRNYNPNIIY